MKSREEKIVEGLLAEIQESLLQVEDGLVMPWEALRFIKHLVSAQMNEKILCVSEDSFMSRRTKAFLKSKMKKIGMRVVQ